MNRLNQKNLGQLPQAVQRPLYDRTKLECSIVHLGIGSFHRAHEAVYTEAVLAAGDLAWGITGAGVVSHAMKDALAPQDGLYTLVQMGKDSCRFSVIGSIVEVLGGPEDAGELLARMSDRRTRIVSLTVTEKGYFLDLTTGELLLQAPEIVADLRFPETPKTAIGLIAAALGKRRRAGIPPFTVLSCDNLPNNGTCARTAVVSFARQFDAALAAWIENEVCFPCTMVDGITPATTHEDRAFVQANLGMEDAWPVVREPFYFWVIEDDFSMGRPDWTLGGVVFAEDIESWERLKLYCLNGAHSTLAFLGLLSGCVTVADAMRSRTITDVLEQYWEEVQEVLQSPRELDAADYIDAIRERFRNPSIKYLTEQVASDSSQKIPQRLLAPLRQRLAKGLSSPAILTAIAAWMHYVVIIARTPGKRLNDPLAAEIVRQARRGTLADDVIDNFLSLGSIFGTDLTGDPRFRVPLKNKFIELAANPSMRTSEHLVTQAGEASRMEMENRGQPSIQKRRSNV